jgi:hypothetical protein
MRQICDATDSHLLGRAASARGKEIRALALPQRFDGELAGELVELHK